jgi:hypothetical protein
MNETQIKELWLAEVKGQPYALKQPKPEAPPRQRYVNAIAKNKIIVAKILENVEKWETMTAREIAKELGVTKSAVFNNFYKMGLKFRKLNKSRGAKIRESKRARSAVVIISSVV